MASKKPAADAPPKKGTIAHTLAVIANGGKLTRERVFPFPHKMVLRWPENGKTQEYVLGEGHVAALLNEKYIKPNSADVQKNPDCIHYFITERGVERAGERAA